MGVPAVNIFYRILREANAKSSHLKITHCSFCLRVKDLCHSICFSVYVLNIYVILFLCVRFKDLCHSVSLCTF